MLDIIIIFIVIIIILLQLNHEHFIVLEKNKNAINMCKNLKIPKKIWQTHETNDLPQSSYENIKKLIEKNPDFEYNFHTKEDRRDYIKNNFDDKVLEAYDKINPGAGKADIWRLGIILKEGGIYIDVDKIPNNNSKSFSEILDEEDEFVHGRNWHIYGYDAPSTNATICAAPNHPVIKMTFDSVINSILNKEPLESIGPHKGWAELENYTGTPHLWKSISHHIGKINMEEGRYDNGINISNKLEDQLQQNSKYGDDLKELNVAHWTSQPVFVEEKQEENNKTIIQTYYDKSLIPERVYENIKTFAPEYKHVIFDDNECISFLEKHFPQNVANKFKNLELGCHKADLFRYCYLYINGGLYLDIKTVLIKPIREIFTNENFIYSVFSIGEGTIYQGIIFSPPKEKLFKILIDKFMETNNKQIKNNYSVITQQFYDTVLELTQQTKLESGLNGDKYYFFNEKGFDAKHCNGKLDRYGICVFAVDKNNNKIIKIRDEDFPYTKGHNKIIEQKEFPKIIHQIFWDFSGKDRKIEEIAEYNACSKSWKENHKDWEYKLWYGKEMHDFAKKEFPEYFEKWNNLPKKIMKVDTFRYMLMYKIGGLYTDLDEESFQSINFIVDNEKYKKYNTILFCDNDKNNRNCDNSILISKKNNYFWIELLNEIFENIDKNQESVWDATGQNALFKIYNKTLFKYKILELNPRNSEDQNFMIKPPDGNSCLKKLDNYNKEIENNYLLANWNNTPQEIHWLRGKVN